MSTNKSNIIEDPIGTLRELFHSTQGGADLDSLNSDFGEKELISEALAKAENLKQVPALNVNDIHGIPNGALVRYRGMVQDMFNPEIYIGAFREPGADWQLCKYSDMIPESPSEDAETKMWERRPFYCVPVPGEAEWFRRHVMPAKPQEPPCEGTGQGARDAKRGREDESSEAESSAMVSAMTVDSELEGSAAAAALADSASSLGGLAKQRRGHGEGRGSPGAERAGRGLASAPGETLPCLVQVYDCGASVLLNDIVEVVGVLSHAPEIAQLGFSGEAEDDELAAHPPTSRVPRLHALLVSTTSSTPALDARPRVPPPAAPLSELREQAMRILSAVLGNDRLAAEYTLLHLLSRVVSRRDGVMVGGTALNITGWPEAASAATDLPEASETMLSMLRELVPRAAALPVTVEGLNREPLVPRKDYSTDRLVEAPLQLAPGTHLLLDESALGAGQLQEQGVANVQAIQGLVRSQELEYDFQFYKVPMKTDLPVVIVSKGRTILRDAGATQVPLAATTAVGDPDALHAALAVSDVEEVRRYLAHARATELEFPDEMKPLVEEAIRSYRKERANTDPDVFHRWMTMARLMSASLGHSAVSREAWESVRRMEHAREERLRVV